ASDVKRKVSPGATCFNRNFFPFVIRKWLASLCAFLIVFFEFIIFFRTRVSIALDLSPGVGYCQIIVSAPRRSVLGRFLMAGDGAALRTIAPASVLTRR